NGIGKEIPFRANTYHNHDKQKKPFSPQKYRLDLTLESNVRDERGFYDPELAVKFLIGADAAAQKANVKWRVIYNDFQVAKAVKEQIAQQQGPNGKQRPRENHVNFQLNHGPEPFKLHMHFDILPIAPTCQESAQSGS